jgi:hypothetical protein
VITATSDPALAWTYGAWVQVVAANDLASHVLSNIFTSIIDGAQFDIELQVGTGGAGSEVVRGTWATTNSIIGASLAPSAPIHVFPLLILTANARFAVRIATSVANHNVGVALGFLPTPL